MSLALCGRECRPRAPVQDRRTTTICAFSSVRLWIKLRLNFPIFSGFGQFGPPHLVPWETGPRRPFSTTDMHSASSLGSGASARAVTTSIGFGRFVHKILDPQRVNGGRRAGDLHGLAQKRRLLADALDQMDLRTFGVGERAGDAPCPGNPAPEPRSAQTLASGARARSCSEFGDMPGPEHRDRRGRDQIGRAACQAISSSTKRSSRAAVSRETGGQGQGAFAVGGQVERFARSRRPRPPRSCGAAIALAALPVDMGRQQRQRRRRDAIEPARLADGARPCGLQLVADFVGEPGQRSRSRCRRQERGSRRGDRTPRRPPAGRDRPRTWHRSRAARRSWVEFAEAPARCARCRPMPMSG